MEFSSASRRDRDPRRGARAGALGGIVAGIVKIGCEAIVPARAPDREAPPAILLQRFASRPLTDEEKRRGSLAIHFAISAGVGALYGALAEVVPPARAGGGSLFGLLVWTGTHETALPALELTPPLPEVPAAEQINEAVTHVLFGVVVETVRARLRGDVGASGEDGIQ